MNVFFIEPQRPPAPRATESSADTSGTSSALITNSNIIAPSSESNHTNESTSKVGIELSESCSKVQTTQSGLRSQLMQRAKRRTLRMTIAIVVTFILCWTPYAVALTWDQLDSKSLKRHLPSWLRDFFFIFAVTNSCVNPFVHSYQLFANCVRTQSTAKANLRRHATNNRSGRFITMSTTGDVNGTNTCIDFVEPNAETQV